MTPPAQPKPAPAAAPEPRFVPSKAISVPPRRHEPTARTVGFVQPTEEDGRTDLFSVGGAYIATVSNAEAATFLPPPEPAPEPAAS